MRRKVLEEVYVEWGQNAEESTGRGGEGKGSSVAPFKTVIDPVALSSTLLYSRPQTHGARSL